MIFKFNLKWIPPFLIAQLEMLVYHQEQEDFLTKCKTVNTIVIFDSITSE